MVGLLGINARAIGGKRTREKEPKEAGDKDDDEITITGDTPGTLVVFGV